MKGSQRGAQTTGGRQVALCDIPDVCCVVPSDSVEGGRVAPWRPLRYFTDGRRWREIAGWRQFPSLSTGAYNLCPVCNVDALASLSVEPHVACVSDVLGSVFCQNEVLDANNVQIF